MIYFSRGNININRYSTFLQSWIDITRLIPKQVLVKICRLNVKVTSVRKSEQNKLESRQRESGENREEACLVTSSETFILALLVLLCSTAHAYRVVYAAVLEP